MAAEQGGLYMDYTWYKPLCMVYTIYIVFMVSTNLWEQDRQLIIDLCRRAH